MSHFHEIYASKAEKYDQMVSREDYEGNILQTIEQIRPLKNTAVVELGAGTGRLTTMLAPHVRQITALDNASHMLQKAKQNLQNTSCHNWYLATCDNRFLSLPAQMADIAIAGWSIGHTVGWYPDDWKHEIEKVLAEMRRILKPGGTIMILETLGTGRETPLPPTLHLADYYNWLETHHQFTPTWFRTDYLFRSPEEGAQLTRFFFGDNMAASILENNLQILPECTGLWWAHC